MSKDRKKILRNKQRRAQLHKTSTRIVKSIYFYNIFVHFDSMSDTFNVKMEMLIDQKYRIFIDGNLKTEDLASKVPKVTVLRDQNEAIYTVGDAKPVEEVSLSIAESKYLYTHIKGFVDTTGDLADIGMFEQEKHGYLTIEDKTIVRPILDRQLKDYLKWVHEYDIEENIEDIMSNKIKISEELGRLIESNTLDELVVSMVASSGFINEYPDIQTELLNINDKYNLGCSGVIEVLSKIYFNGYDIDPTKCIYVFETLYGKDSFGVLSKEIVGDDIQYSIIDRDDLYDYTLDSVLFSLNNKDTIIKDISNDVKLDGFMSVKSGTVDELKEILELNE